jgi:hypothetical protein
VFIIICVDATCRKDSNVDVFQIAAIGQIQCPDNIASNRLFLVILTPIDIGATGASSTVENMCRLIFLELSNDGFAILHTNSGRVDFFALALEEGLKMACRIDERTTRLARFNRSSSVVGSAYTCNPSFSSPDQKDGL